MATFGDFDRDPRMRVVSVAYLALTPNQPVPTAGSDAADAVWIPVQDALAAPLAFDHNTILSTCVERARAKLEYTNLATTLAGRVFTLADLHRIYEVVWNATLDLPDFRRKVLAAVGFVEPTGSKRAGTGGCPISSQQGRNADAPDHAPGVARRVKAHTTAVLRDSRGAASSLIHTAAEAI